MSYKKILMVFFAIIINLIIAVFPAANALADDEQETFTISNAPDTLIVIDLSGSMAQNPSGGSYKYGNSSSCVEDTTHCVCD